MPTEKLFKTFDETEHNYTWDYTTREKAINLFDVNKKYFAIITEREEIADETGAMLDYRHNTYYIWNLHSKKNIKQGIKPIARWGKMEWYVLNEKTGEMVEVGKKEVLNKAKKKSYGANIKEVKNILLDAGKIYISDGNLVLKRKN